MDEQFISKVYRSILYTWALAMVWCFALWKPWIALSISLGIGLGTAILASYEIVIRRVFVPNAEKPRHELLKFALVKYPLLGILLYGLVRWHRINIFAFCGGLALVHFAILAKLAGIKIVEHQRRMKPVLVEPIFESKRKES